VFAAVYPGGLGAARVHIAGAVLDSGTVGAFGRVVGEVCRAVVVGADGTPPARAAGRGLPRLLRTVIVTAGLAALGWLLSTLLATGAAAAESTPDTGSPGLLGGLVGGLTHLLGATADTGTADPPGDTTATRPAPVNPIVAAPPASSAPTPAPATATSVRSPAPATADRPAPAAKPGRTAAAAHRSTRATARSAPAAPPSGQPPTGDRPTIPASDHTGRKPAPDPAPTAPAAPTSSVSPGHDGPGHARGGAALPAGTAAAVPPAGPHTDFGRASLAGSRTAGLPAMSPD
jgi:hypothetical protein